MELEGACKAIQSNSLLRLKAATVALTSGDTFLYISLCCTSLPLLLAFGKQGQGKAKVGVPKVKQGVRERPNKSIQFGQQLHRESGRNDSTREGVN